MATERAMTKEVKDQWFSVASIKQLIQLIELYDGCLCFTSSLLYHDPFEK